MKDTEKFVITHEGALDNAHQIMKHMLSENGWLKVQVKAGNRSLDQNSLYWVWIAQITDELNRRNNADFSTKEVHMRMKHDFLGYDDPKQIGSAEIPGQLKSTADLTKGEMFHYMERLDMFWAERGVLLVTPSDSIYAETKAKNEGRE